MGKNWPRLTETLRGPRNYHACSSCGVRPTALVDLQLWQEHDDNDKPEMRFILLCKRCEPMIKPHPRLYAQHHRWAPAPGASAICEGCRFRDGLSCTHPNLTATGGVGLMAGKHTVALVDGTRGGRRTGWREVFYSEPPKECRSFQPKPAVQEDVVEL